MFGLSNVRTNDAMNWGLVTDIDGTLIGESESTDELRQVVLEARVRLARAGARLHWVVATGRTYASTCEVLNESGFRLDDFDALIARRVALPDHDGVCDGRLSRRGAGTRSVFVTGCPVGE